MCLHCQKKHSKVDTRATNERRIIEVNEFSPELNISASRKAAKDNRYDKGELKKYPKNISETTKYNIITFLPKSLLFQFTKYTNIYFGLLLIPTFFKVVAAYELKSELPPFVFIILVALVRELIEDLRRYKSDR